MTGALKEHSKCIIIAGRRAGIEGTITKITKEKVTVKFVLKKKEIERAFNPGHIEPLF